MKKQISLFVCTRLVVSAFYKVNFVFFLILFTKNMYKKTAMVFFFASLLLSLLRWNGSFIFSPERVGVEKVLVTIRKHAHGVAT